MTERKVECPVDQKPFNERQDFWWPDGETKTLEVKGEQIIVTAYEDKTISHNPDSLCALRREDLEQTLDAGLMVENFPCFRCQQRTGFRRLNPRA